MKVICIDASKGKICGNTPKFKEGELLTVKQCSFYEMGYEVLEYPFGDNGQPTSWLKSRFIPTSNIDETELLEQREEALLLSSIKQ